MKKFYEKSIYTEGGILKTSFLCLKFKGFDTIIRLDICQI